jgi:WD40 repeat protein
MGPQRAFTRSVAVTELNSRPIVASGGADRTVRVWDLATGTPISDPFTGHDGSVYAVAVAELDGRPVVVSGGRAVMARERTSAPATGVTGRS